MTVSIGRAGLGTGWLVPTFPVSFDGDEMRLTGWISCETADEARAARQQLRGLVDPGADEPVVPVVFTEEPQLDGFYQVGDVSVGRVPGDQPVAPFAATLRRIPGFSYGHTELIGTAAIPDNDFSWDDFTVGGRLWFPSGTFDITSPTPNFGPVGGWGAGEGALTEGADAGLGYAVFGNTTPFQFSMRFVVEPAAFYTGAATLQTGDGLHTVVGRQISDADADVGWQLTNGRIRVRNGSTPGTILTEAWDGAAWTSPKQYLLGSWSDGDLEFLRSLRVLRNDPHAVTIRLAGRTASAKNDVNVDIHLARGWRAVRLTITMVSVVNATARWQVNRATAEAGVAMTDLLANQVGIEAANADADGNKFFIAMRRENVIDTTNGGIRLDDPLSSADFFIGYDDQAYVDGSGVFPIPMVVFAEQQTYAARQVVSVR